MESQKRFNVMRGVLGLVFRFASAIYTFSVSDFYNPNCKFIVLYRIDNTVVSLPNTAQLMPREFFTTHWARITSKFFNTCNDSI